MNIKDLLSSSSFLAITSKCIGHDVTVKPDSETDNLDSLLPLDECGQWSCESTTSKASFQTVGGEH